MIDEMRRDIDKQDQAGRKAQITAARMKPHQVRCLRAFGSIGKPKPALRRCNAIGPLVGMPHKPRSTLNSASTPSTAKISAATPRRSGIESFLAKVSPNNTAGTSAISMPSVVPATTVTKS